MLCVFVHKFQLLLKLKPHEEEENLENDLYIKVEFSLRNKHNPSFIHSQSPCILKSEKV